MGSGEGARLRKHLNLEQLISNAAASNLEQLIRKASTSTLKG
jgi:hypothetical protein